MQTRQKPLGNLKHSYLADAAVNFHEPFIFNIGFVRKDDEYVRDKYPEMIIYIHQRDDALDQLKLSYISSILSHENDEDDPFKKIQAIFDQFKYNYMTIVKHYKNEMKRTNANIPQNIYTLRNERPVREYTELLRDYINSGKFQADITGPLLRVNNVLERCGVQFSNINTSQFIYQEDRCTRMFMVQAVCPNIPNKKMVIRFTIQAYDESSNIYDISNDELIQYELAYTIVLNDVRIMVTAEFKSFK